MSQPTPNRIASSGGSTSGHAIPARPSGRPRSAAAEEKIIEAVLQLLAEGVRYGALSIEAIAAQARVGKATIYRRWANKNDLLLDAVTRLKAPQPEVKGRSIREDLVDLLNVVQLGTDPRTERVFSCLVPEAIRHPELRDLCQRIVAPRRERTQAVLRRGVQTGELRGDVDIEITALMLSGGVVMQRMLAWNPSVEDETLAERVVDAVLAGITAPAARFAVS